ncbi:MAG: ABC transporter ATP-binding protein [Pirellulaceae bacterium]|nr:ABC transporter ATP-binding protein [Pirellulaceae bacterium]
MRVVGQLLSDVAGGAMSQGLLEVKNVHKAYGSHRALCGASFHVLPGEMLALLGPNGAGKTTLIRAICGRHRLDAGEVNLEGRVLRKKSQRARLGFVPQELALYSDLTVQQNLEVFGRLHGVRRRDLKSQVDRALQWTRLVDRRDELARQLSGGMQRRLNIACGVLHNPIVLLLDEPTVGVDPQSRERIFEMLRELKQQGTSIVLTTHQLDEAESQCDRIVIIDRGKVIASGTLDSLIEKTVGHSRKLTLWMRATTEGQAVQGSHTVEINNIVQELPSVLDKAESNGVEIDRLNMSAPSLQDVFLHLTGKELRE